MLDGKEIIAKYEPKTPKILTAEPQVSLARFSPCGKLLVGGGYDARVRRWNASSSGRPRTDGATGGRTGANHAKSGSVDDDQHRDERSAYIDTGTAGRTRANPDADE